MERKLPIAKIAGTSFYVDVLREELRQTDNSGNRISFNELSECKDGYSFIYDIRTRNAPADQESENDQDHIVKVTLLALMELDPVGLAEKYGIPIEVFASGAEMPVEIEATIEPIIITKKK